MTIKIQLATFVAVLSFFNFSFIFSTALNAADDSLIEEDNFSRPLEEVLVSDFRGSENKRVPSSVSIFNSDTIDDITVQHFEELTQSVPNLNWSGGASRPRYFQIRGIGERSQYEGAPNPSVGFVIDDLDFSALGGVATMFDVDQVEVLRGPQGTRYGANALAGLIYVQYKKPSDVFDALFTATLGSDDTRTLGTAFGGPLSESINYRAVIHKSQNNGFRRNAYLNRDDTNGRDETSLRFKLDYMPGDNWAFDLSAMHIDLDNGYDAFAVDNSFVTQSDRPGQDAQQSTGLVLSSTGELNNGLQFKSITGAAKSNVIFSFDADWGNNDFWSPVIYDYFSHTERERKNLSQEFRLASTPNTGLFNNKVDWVTGVIVSNNTESNLTQDDGNYEGFLDASSIKRDYEASTAAIFGDVNFALNERTTLNTGLRYEKRNADYSDSNGDVFDTSENSIGGQVALNYQLNDSTDTYVKIARGYKAGGFNLGLPAEAANDTLLFDAEYLWNYELGLKGHYWNDRLALNASAFWMQRRDQQVQSSTQLDPTNPATFIFFTDNAGKGKNQGIEMDAALDVNTKFTVNATLGLLSSEVETDNDSNTGRDQAHAPRYTYSIGSKYSFNDHWVARIDISGKDEFYFSDSHNQVSDPYALVNAKLAYTKDNWSLTAWGRNLFDETYAVRGFYFGNEPARDFADTLYLRLADPRHYGITYQYQY